MSSHISHTKRERDDENDGQPFRNNGHEDGNRHDELVDHDFLTPVQVRRLSEGQAFLWRVRFALHIMTGRREDRILFDHQVKLAEMLGYEDATYTLGVEQMMQRYYRTVLATG